jgi:uncharacterized GH25 family protein
MKLVVGIVLLMLVAASVAVAHDTWINTRELTRSRVTFEVSSGMEFPKLDSAPSPDRVAAAGWRVGDRTGRFEDMRQGARSLELAMDVDGSGTVVAWVAFKPKDIDMEAGEVDEYFDEIGAPERLRRTWEAMGPDRAWHETYTKYAKTFVSVGDGGEDPSCIPALGTAVELVPVRDPTTVAAGDSLVIRVLRKGIGSEGQAVAALCGKSGERTIKYSNRSGHVSFMIEEAGPWLFSATELRLQTDGTWTSDFTTMSFTVEK